MTTPVYLCPDCGFNELSIKNQGIKGPDGKSIATATCPNCTWVGSLRDTVGVLTTERIWTSEQIGNLMMRITAKHAAGPMIQAYEFIGLLPKMVELPAGTTPPPTKRDIETAEKHNRLAQEARDYVMRATLVAAISAGFEAAEEMHRKFATEMGLNVHHVLNEPEPGIREFGGDVVPFKSEP